VFERPDGSGRRLTLVDLAGHEKYLRTTIYGFNRWDLILFEFYCLTAVCITRPTLSPPPLFFTSFTSS